MKQCTKCNKYLSLEKFYPRENGRLRSHCKDCVNKENLNNYFKSKPDRLKASYKYNLKRNYNLSIEDYNKLYLVQNSLCAICKETLSNRFLGIEGKASVVDHNHTNGFNRELLCTDCNKGLGSFKDSIIVINDAIKYLEKHCN